MYIPMFIKTDYSILTSLLKINDLIPFLKEKGITTIGIVDDNLSYVMEYYNELKKNNIKLIPGLELFIEDKPIYLYAKNYEGYQNLCYITSNPITIDNIKNNSSNLIMVLPYKSKDLYDTFNLPDTYLAFTESDEIDYSFKNIYLNIIRCLYKNDLEYLKYLELIKQGKTISEEIIINNDYYKEIELDKSILDNYKEIDSLCNFEIKKNDLLPKYDFVDDDSKSYLEKLCKKGLMKRFNNKVPMKYADRLMMQLDVINSMGFNDYFLVVWDYVKFAKKNNILVGPGRGSAAGSLVSYSLGITDIDPIKYDLLFERFLNKDRITMPDIDTDFPDDKRDEVIEYVKNKYGKENVSGIITFGTLGGRAIVRDVGRVLNCNSKYIDIICKKIPFKGTLNELKNSDKEINLLIENDSKLKQLYNIVNIMEGVKRHTSIHAAGIVISRKPLINIVPIKNNEEINLTEYTMDYLEEQGLIKMDFLGIKNLKIISNIISDIYKNTGKKINFYKIPLDDKDVMDLFKKGDTTGIFQFESASMRKFLKDLKPDNFLDLCDAIALFRPGPSGSIPSYIKRKEGKERITYIDPSIEDILKPTKGIIIYQEQIMKIAEKYAGYTLSEADLLRRAMSKKKVDVLKNEQDRFIKKSIENGHDKEKAKSLFDLIYKFSGYGFNKSHSVSYSLVSYRMAYLKKYYPKEFFSNLLSGVIGSEEKTIEYLTLVKKLGIRVLPPDINKSLSDKFLVENNTIIFPLSSIRNVGALVSNYIIEKRGDGYKDIYDFLNRTLEKTNNKRILESLIYSHSLDNFYNTKTLINNLDNILNYVELTKDLGDSLEKPIINKEKEYDIEDVLEHEKSVFGTYITSHVTEKYKLNNKNIVNLIDIERYINKKINVIVLIDRIKEITTKKGDAMAFINSSDNTGSVSITMFPESYKNYNNIKRKDIIKVFGKVDKRYSDYSILCDKIEVLNK